MKPLFTRDTLIQYLLDHKEKYPDKGDYEVELRSFFLAAPPTCIQHDDRDKVLILIGVQHK